MGTYLQKDRLNEIESKGILVIVQFFRVEDINGYGPYTIHGANSGKLEKMHEAHSVFRSPNHPTPWFDGELFLRFNEDHVCGFESFEKMCEWFDGWGTELADAGYRVNVYRVDAEHLARGNKQACVELFRLTDLQESYSTIGL